MSTRRQFLVASAAVPALWIAPQVLSVSPASAVGLNSQPPQREERSTTAEPMMGPALPEGIHLAYTGPNAKRDAEVGAAVLVAGAAVVAVTRTPRRLT